MPTIRIALPPLMDFPRAIAFLATRTVPSIETVTPTEYRRNIRLAASGLDVGHVGPLSLAIRYRRASDGRMWLLARAWPAITPDELRRVVVRMFDLDADLSAFRDFAARDPILAPLVEQLGGGLRLPQLLDPFEALVRAVLGQQVSVVAAGTMTDRVVRLLGAPVVAAGVPTLARSDGAQWAAEFPPFVFPVAEDLAQVSVEGLRGIGLTRAKAATLISLGRAVAEGTVSLAAVRSATAVEAERTLVALPGIGPWTASYVRMRSLGDRDAFPAADLGVIKALAARGIARAEIAAVAERWTPWRAYAVLHLWESL